MIRKARDSGRCSVPEHKEKGGREFIWYRSRCSCPGIHNVRDIGHQSMNMNPPIIPPRTIRRPYSPPKPRARVWIRAEATLLLDAVDDPPKPVNVLVAEVPAVLDPALLAVVVAAMVEMVEVFTRTGFCAPQGLSERQALWQEVSVCSHLLTQFVAAWVHSK